MFNSVKTKVYKGFKKIQKLSSTKIKNIGNNFTKSERFEGLTQTIDRIRMSPKTQIIVHYTTIIGKVVVFGIIIWVGCKKLSSASGLPPELAVPEVYPKIKLVGGEPSFLKKMLRKGKIAKALIKGSLIWVVKNPSTVKTYRSLTKSYPLTVGNTNINLTPLGYFCSVIASKTSALSFLLNKMPYGKSINQLLCSKLPFGQSIDILADASCRLHRTSFDMKHIVNLGIIGHSIQQMANFVLFKIEDYAEDNLSNDIEDYFGYRLVSCLLSERYDSSFNYHFVTSGFCSLIHLIKQTCPEKITQLIIRYGINPVWLINSIHPLSYFIGLIPTDDAECQKGYEICRRTSTSLLMLINKFGPQQVQKPLLIKTGEELLKQNPVVLFSIVQEVLKPVAIPVP